MTLDPTADAWIRVSRKALVHNYTAIQGLLAEDGAEPPQIIAVVKANGFGHGAGETACTLQASGADFFAVTTPGEALELRAAGITGRILVFLPPLPDQLPALLAAELDLTVCDSDGLSALDAALAGLSRPARVHLKVDTGMGRLGALPDEALALGRRIAADDRLAFAGIYTHFAKALENDPAATQKQFAVFQQVIERLRDEGIAVGLRHCANSAAIVLFPEMRLDAVRPGTILYGQYPSRAVPRRLTLQDTWQMQARVVAVREVPKGTPIGYGGEYVTRRPTRLAVLPVGYADGFTVAPASANSGLRGVKTLLRDLMGHGAGLSVRIRGANAPVLGRVAMQICSADVTDIPGVQPGDVVDIPARRITASARLPRVYED
jgi:alanine racemase